MGSFRFRTTATAAEVTAEETLATGTPAKVGTVAG